MSTIYFNNFRGFSNTFLKLLDVNFLVGENSTGKTSLLKLLKWISSSSFSIFTEDYNSEDFEFDNFYDIISEGEKIDDFFEIGILNDSIGKLGVINAAKIKFINRNGTPFISEMKMHYDNKNILMIRKQNRTDYQITECLFKLTSDESSFKKWILEKNSKELHTKRIRGKIPFFFQIQFMISIIEKEKNKAKEIKKEEGSPLILPKFINDISWHAPIRAKPQNTYSSYKISFSPEGAHAPYLLKKILSKTSKKATSYISILKDFGKRSGLYDNIEIKTFGKSENDPFEIRIILINKSLRITKVGYGISQILPLIIEILFRSKNTWFGIQQPEIHLHPKAQAEFGEFIYLASKIDGQKFIIETHSDYIVDRFRLNKNKNDRKSKTQTLDESKSQIIFFERTNSGNKLTCLPILSNGSICENQPRKFRDFFIKEDLNLIQI